MTFCRLTNFGRFCDSFKMVYAPVKRKFCSQASDRRLKRSCSNAGSLLPCKQALLGALAAGREKEGELATSWNLNCASNSPVAPRRLSCQIAANKREAETSADVKQHRKTRESTRQG